MTNQRVPVYREIAGEIDASRTPTLDVGCGNNKIPGAVGIDLVAGTQADIVHDLNTTPWPLESACSDTKPAAKRRSRFRPPSK